jgi:hypothetical protein
MGHMRPETARRFTKWMFIVLLSMGLLIVYGGLSSYLRGKKMLRWPTAIGTIKTSEILGDDKSVEEAVKAQEEATVQTSIWYEANIMYAYEVDGKQYEFNRITQMDIGDTDTYRATLTIRKYTVGMEVNVFYNPDNPAEAILEPAGGVDGVAGAIMGGITILLSLLPYIGWRKVSRELAPKKKP